MLIRNEFLGLENSNAVNVFKETFPCDGRHVGKKKVWVQLDEPKKLYAKWGEEYDPSDIDMPVMPPISERWQLLLLHTVPDMTLRIEAIDLLDQVRSATGYSFKKNLTRLANLKDAIEALQGGDVEKAAKEKDIKEKALKALQHVSIKSMSENERAAHEAATVAAQNEHVAASNMLAAAEATDGLQTVLHSVLACANYINHTDKAAPMLGFLLKYCNHYLNPKMPKFKDNTGTSSLLTTALRKLAQSGYDVPVNAMQQLRKKLKALLGDDSPRGGEKPVDPWAIESAIDGVHKLRQQLQEKLSALRPVSSGLPDGADGDAIIGKLRDSIQELDATLEPVGEKPMEQATHLTPI